jgi:hypothetical protein
VIFLINGVALTFFAGEDGGCFHIIAAFFVLGAS